MKNIFQVIILVIFIAAAVFGVLVFSGVIPIGDEGSAGGQGTVVIWGTLKDAAISKAIEDFNQANTTFVVKYVEKSPDTFDQNLLEGLASGTGPDMFFLPDDLAFHYKNKITAIPYASYPLATFKNTFAGAGEVFLTPSGILAYPLVIDPLIMYYNRSMLDASAITNPPVSWDEMSKVVPLLTKRDDANKIIKSAISFGHFSNVAHAKDILATLFMQAGNPIVALLNGTFQPTLVVTSSGYDPSSIMKFYTDFSDPSKTVYSWNKSFPNSRDAFSKEDLAFYFGFTSELPSLVNQNPNQNFFVAPVPQNKNATFKLTMAHVTGLAISSSSKNFNTAFIVANLMATGDFADKIRIALGIAPARRDLLAKKPEDAFSPIFYDSALFGKSWLDPSPNDTNDIFRKMTEGVLSNNMTPDNAIMDANNKLSLLLLK